MKSWMKSGLIAMVLAVPFVGYSIRSNSQMQEIQNLKNEFGELSCENVILEEKYAILEEEHLALEVRYGGVSKSGKYKERKIKWLEFQKKVLSGLGEKILERMKTRRENSRLARLKLQRELDTLKLKYDKDASNWEMQEV